MNADAEKRSSRYSISWIVVTGGMLVGTAYLLLVAPVIFFTIGKNDSRSAVLLGMATILSFLPASFAALYRRRIAGLWLTLTGGCAALAEGWNTFHVIESKRPPVDLGEVFGSTIIYLLPFAVGIFLLVTSALGWAEMKEGF